MAKKNLIGSGIIFPLTLTPEGRVPIYSDTELIKASIKTIIAWFTSTRFFNESFGSRLEEVLEEPNDPSSAVLARLFIVEALEKWEKRIIVGQRDISIKVRKEIIIIEINYLIKTSQEMETLIFPYYRNIQN